MTIPGLVQAEVSPQGELGMAGVNPDVLRAPKKVLSDLVHHFRRHQRNLKETLVIIKLLFVISI